jgi:hypothetical protein
MASTPDAGGAERLVELGILESMVSVFCAAQRMVARMDLKHLGEAMKERTRTRGEYFAVTRPTHCNRYPQPSRYQHRRLDRWCY